MSSSQVGAGKGHTGFKSTKKNLWGNQGHFKSAWCQQLLPVRVLSLSHWVKWAQLPPGSQVLGVAGDNFGTELLLVCSLQHIGSPRAARELWLLTKPDKDLAPRTPGCCFLRNVTCLLSAQGSRFCCLWPGLYPQLICALASCFLSLSKGNSVHWEETTIFYRLLRDSLSQT